MLLEVHKEDFNQLVEGLKWKPDEESLIGLAIAIKEKEGYRD